MRYFSMFSGIGGFEKGIEDAEPEWECAGYGKQASIRIYGVE